jgi:CTP:molybdopterin cytidylyltransferase MocA
VIAGIVLAARSGSLLLLLGARAEEIVAGVDFGTTEPIICADWQEGQAASLRRVIEAVGHDATAAILTPSASPASACGDRRS